MKEALDKIKRRNIDKLFTLLDVRTMEFDREYITDFFIERDNTTYYLFECSNYDEFSNSKDLTINIESIEEIYGMKYNKFIHACILEFVSERFTIVDVIVYDENCDNVISQYE